MGLRLLDDPLCRYNIKYGNMDATDAEVEEAAALADIHDTILSFPDKVDGLLLLFCVMSFVRSCLFFP